MSGSYGAAVGHLWGTYRSLILPHQLAELWASFRGRRLGGRERPLPHGYQGGILQRSPPSSLDSDLQEVTVTATFGAITEWEADSVPPPQGGLAHALQWGPLAQAIHSPVPDDSEEEAEPR